MYNPWTGTKGRECWRVRGYRVEGKEKGENWENCNSIINKVYFKKETKKNMLRSLYSFR